MYICCSCKGMPITSCAFRVMPPSFMKINANQNMYLVMRNIEGNKCYFELELEHLNLCLNCPFTCSMHTLVELCALHKRGNRNK